MKTRGEKSELGQPGSSQRTQTKSCPWRGRPRNGTKVADRAFAELGCDFPKVCLRSHPDHGSGTSWSGKLEGPCFINGSCLVQL